jgi:hypothetical protein
LDFATVIALSKCIADVRLFPEYAFSAGTKMVSAHSERGFVNENERGCRTLPDGIARDRFARVVDDWMYSFMRQAFLRPLLAQAHEMGRISLNFDS